jgi:hypothetical protein
MSEHERWAWRPQEGPRGKTDLSHSAQKGAGKHRDTEVKIAHYPAVHFQKDGLPPAARD